MEEIVILNLYMHPTIAPKPMKLKLTEVKKEMDKSTLWNQKLIHQTDKKFTKDFLYLRKTV